MGQEIIGILGIALLFALLCCGVHIGVASGLAGILGMMIVSGPDPTFRILGSVAYSDLASFSWVAVPLFIIMGDFAMCSGISESAFQACLDG